MRKIDPDSARQFAVSVVRKLDGAGYRALWAGGCVRDQLRGVVPKDYDVATSATPEEIQAVFGKRRTIPVGAAFGVITVLGPRRAGQIEVATFRRDATYSDGRHPDSVSYTNEREDAVRRDFTINGMFYDPLTEKVIDYVGGQQDLAARQIRAIGDAHQRLAEDKLRMLRAIRFAATFSFRVDRATWDAVCEHAEEISLVSAERIADELRRMLVLPRRRVAVELLEESGLLSAVLPECDVDLEHSLRSPAVWEQTRNMLDALERPAFPVSLAMLLRPLTARSPGTDWAGQIGRRLKLSNQEVLDLQLCLTFESDVLRADQLPWPRIQRLLTQPRVISLVDYAAAVASVIGGSNGVAFCRERLAWPIEKLDPPPLLTGNDLRAAGLTPGPAFGSILEKIRDAQLEGRLDSREEALQEALRLARGKKA